MSMIPASLLALEHSTSLTSPMPVKIMMSRAEVSRC
jgi:hypothetical protein